MNIERLNEDIMTIERFEDLLIWQKSKELTLLIYKAFEHNRDYSFLRNRLKERQYQS